MAAMATVLTPDALDWGARLDYMAQIPIQDKAGNTVDFRPNWLQTRLYKAAEAQMQTIGKVRLLVLKGRRGGASEGVTRWFDADTTLFRNRQATMCSNDTAGTQYIWEKLGRIQEAKPAEYRHKTRGGKDFTLTSIRYRKPHNSTYRCRTAGTKSAGRGGENHDLHWSEVAWTLHAKDFWTSMGKTVPNEPGTAIVWETTANGEDEAFFPAWQGAKDRLRRNPQDLDGWYPLFFCWLDDPDCRLDVPPWYQWGELDEDERELQTRGATFEQLYFRRHEIAETYFGDPDLFKQEYPSTDEEAFLHSGRAFWKEDQVTRVRELITPGIPYLLAWDFDTLSGMKAQRWEGDTLGATLWRVWAEPEPDHDYIVYADVALGRVADKDDPRSDPDSHYAVVLDRVLFEVVAALHNRMDPGLLGEELLKAAIWYNDAWVGNEVPGAGLVPLERMREHDIIHRGGPHGSQTTKRYLRLYYRGDLPDRIEDREVGRLGLLVDKNTRPLMMQRLRQSLSPERPGEWGGTLKVHDKAFLDTMTTFIVNLDGKPEARTGFHDDPQLALAGALYLHEQCPRQLDWPREEKRVWPSSRDQWIGYPDPQVAELFERIRGGGGGRTWR